MKIYTFNELKKQTNLMETKNEFIYCYLDKNLPNERLAFSINHPYQLTGNITGIDWLDSNSNLDIDVPNSINNLIKNKKLIGVNPFYENCKQKLEDMLSIGDKKLRIHLLALGDVGSTLLMGMRLLSTNYPIDYIGIYDRSAEKLKRFELEINQIYSIDKSNYAPVKILDKNDIFDCDVFIFCASKGVPAVGSNVSDVRMIQLKENEKILEPYVTEACSKNFKGLFMIVSDPVDHLCLSANRFSSKTQSPLLPDQIMGFGLGVMNARATYYSKKIKGLENYISNGQAFGPHGKQLFIVNDIYNYDESLSNLLTKKTITANLEVRNLGFKPYIAPALSSGTLSILSILSGSDNYSAQFLGGVYYGVKNKLVNGRCLSLNSFDMNPNIKERLSKIKNELEEYI